MSYVEYLMWNVECKNRSGHLQHYMAGGSGLGHLRLEHVAAELRWIVIHVSHGDGYLGVRVAARDGVPRPYA